MIRKIWNALADVRLTFWLLMAIAAVMFAGSLYSLVEYQFIDSLNETTVQNWFITRGIGRIGLSWWIAALFLCFTLFGVNLVACTVQRLGALLRASRNYSPVQFFTLLCPTLIHMAFLLVLAGHFITFTTASHARIPIQSGSELSLPDGTKVAVNGIEHVFFPEESLLRGRVAQTKVDLSWKEDDRPVSGTVRFMESLTVNGQTVTLDMKRRKEKEGSGGKEIVNREKNLDEESCNKAQAYHLSRYRNVRTPELYVIATRDPGLSLLVPSFAVMIVLFVYYYAVTGILKNNQE